MMRNMSRNLMFLFLTFQAVCFLACQSEPADSSVESRQESKSLEQAHKAGVGKDGEKLEKMAGAKVPVSHIPPATKRKTYRHAVGFTFMYPADWKARDTEEMLVLTPPNQEKSPQGPAEIYFVAGESVAGEGIHDAMDSAVAQYLDDNITKLAPHLRRTGSPRRVSLSHGKGAVFDWEGKGQDGKMYGARAYVAIINESGVGLYALGQKTLIEKRYPQLQQMFSSFGFTQSQRDQKLIGKWHLSATNSVDNQSPFETSWSRAQAVGDTKTDLELRSNGSWTRVEEFHMIAGAGGLWLESNDRDVDEGTWCAGNGQLHLITKDDMWESYQYRVEGARLRLVSGKKGQVWNRSQ